MRIALWAAFILFGWPLYLPLAALALGLVMPLLYPVLWLMGYRPATAAARKGGPSYNFGGDF